MRLNKQRVLFAGCLASLLVVLFPPWLWSAFGGTFGNGKLLEEPWGIAYGFLWIPPNVIVDFEQEVCVNCSAAGQAVPEELYLSYPLLTTELFLVAIITYYFWHKISS